MKEIFVDSDTKVALLSGAPLDDPTWDLLTNDQIAAARTAVNRISGSRRLLGHAVFTPKRQGWMEEVDRAIATLKPDSWKGYTIGDPLFPSKLASYWWLDDDKLVYPFYEKAVKAGITTVCIHKGLLPADYETSWPGVWEYATVKDVGKAAKDWPKINFVMYHAALRPFLEKPDAALAEFEQDGAHQVGDRPRRDPGKVRCEERLWRGGNRIRDVRGRQSPIRCGLRCGTLVGGSARTTSSGEQTRSGTGRRSGRSRRCAVWRFPRTCRRSTGSSRWARPTAP